MTRRLPLQCCFRSIAGTCWPGREPTFPPPGCSARTDKRDGLPRGRERDVDVNTGSRVGRRAPPSCLHAGRCHAAPSHRWCHAHRARRSGRGRPRGLVVPATARTPGFPRRRLHLRRRVAAELALQIGDGGHLVLRRGCLALDHPHAAGRCRRLRRDGPLRAGVVGAVPDAPGPRRRADPSTRLHARPVDHAPLGRGAALQPGRVLLRRPGRDDEPPHQPLPVRAGHHRLRALQLGGRSPVGEHARPLRPALLDAGRMVRFSEPPPRPGHRRAAPPAVRRRHRTDRLLHPEAGPLLRPGPGPGLRAGRAQPPHAARPGGRSAQRRHHGGSAPGRHHGRALVPSRLGRGAVRARCRHQGAGRHRHRVRRVGLGRAVCRLAPAAPARSFAPA